MNSTTESEKNASAPEVPQPNAKHVKKSKTKRRLDGEAGGHTVW
jgi:hypothetical protein